MRRTAIAARQHIVGIVLDPRFGDRIADIARDFHVWIVASEVNTPAVERFLRSGAADESRGMFDSGVSVFFGADGETPEEMWERVMDLIDDHHGEWAHDPPWSEIRVFGARLSRPLTALLAEYGVTELIPTADGFIGRCVA